ncbi:MAG: hypothetical protein ACJART_000946 [Maribacter sp.]|jgi:hypothetical protein
MKNAIQISVKEPRSQKFDSFSKTREGGYCGSCAKEVVDGTTMSQPEIISYFSKPKGNTYGRFKNLQLSGYEPKAVKNMNTNLVSKGIALFGFSLLALCATPEASAQIATEPNALLNTEVSMVMGRIAIATPYQETYAVKGIILDEENLPLDGVNVVLKGSTEGVVTDFNGEFEFPKKLEIDDILVFSYIGYEYKVVASKSDIIAINISFDASDVFLMGTVVVDGVYESKPNIFQKFISLFK